VFYAQSFSFASLRLSVVAQLTLISRSNNSLINVSFLQKKLLNFLKLFHVCWKFKFSILPNRKNKKLIFHSHNRQFIILPSSLHPFSQTQFWCDYNFTMNLANRIFIRANDSIDHVNDMWVRVERDGVLEKLKINSIQCVLTFRKMIN
jgi:hypothetical protein